jgi:hypothetical protein
VKIHVHVLRNTVVSRGAEAHVLLILHLVAEEAVDEVAPCVDVGCREHSCCAAVYGVGACCEGSEGVEGRGRKEVEFGEVRGLGCFGHCLWSVVSMKEGY